MDSTKPIIGKRSTILFAFAISLFGVIFLWRFWTYGIDVLGINSLFYGLLFITFFIHIKRDSLSKRSLMWLMPLSLICLSMGIYTNSFTKGISAFLLPLIFFIFTTHEAHKAIRSSLWGKSMIPEFFMIVVHYIGCFFQAFNLFSLKGKTRPLLLSNLSKEKKNLAFQIGLGVVILVVFSSLIIVPLLSSADREFEGLFAGIMEILGNIKEYIFDFLANIFEGSFFYKVILTAIGTALLLGYALYWKEELKAREVSEKTEDFGQKYSVTISIILSGILALYLIFIGLQIKTLFIGSLPTDFESTEDLVKTGFWQLFLLTIINIFFYIGLYQKSTKTAQRILSAFTFASLLLIISAAYRTYLYVVTYGFSYEKFYALYTVIFCIGVFVWFLYLDIKKKAKPEIVRNLAFASLWMYALTTIVPLERMIFSANLSLTKQEDSRININELEMLGFDALGSVEKNFDQLIIEAEKDNKQHFKQFGGFMPDQSYKENVGQDWLLWLEINKSKARYVNTSQLEWENGIYKRWYEKTILELIY